MLVVSLYFMCVYLCVGFVDFVLCVVSLIVLCLLLLSCWVCCMIVV